MEPFEIKVGIKTAGPPILIEEKDYTLLKNMLIGDGFHWESTLTVKLPGNIFIIPDSNKDSGEEKSAENISLINSLPLETYLKCVVGSEMNPTAPIEFLKAHAIISRSWVLGKALRLHSEENIGQKLSDTELIGWDDTSSHHGFHVCSDDHCQRYQGVQSIPVNALTAINQTVDEILLDSENGLVDARFSKCCGGYTEEFQTCWQSKKVKCLESFKDPWCNLSGLSMRTRNLLLSSILKEYDKNTRNYGFEWVEEISKEDIRHNLFKHFGRDIGEIKSLEAIHRGPSGRIDLLRLYGSISTLNIGKELWIRRLLSPSHLYSSALEMEDKGDTIKMKGRGWGHGVGLCQIGAANMAYHGYNYKDILSFYYPGSRIGKISEIPNIN